MVHRLRTEFGSVLNSVIFKILREKGGFSVKFCSVLSKSLFMLVGFLRPDSIRRISSGGYTINAKSYTTMGQSHGSNWRSISS